MAAIANPVSSTASVPRALFPHLSDDLFVEVFSFLQANDLQAPAWTCKAMAERVKLATQKNQRASLIRNISSVKSFVNGFLQILSPEKHPAQNESLQMILGKVTSPNFLQSVSSKTDILGIRTQLVGLINSLDPEMFAHLNGCMKPSGFLKDIFVFAELEAQIYHKSTLPDFDVFLAHKAEVFEKVSRNFLEHGNRQRAIEVAQMIRYRSEKDSALTLIFESFLKTGNIDKAGEVARMILSESVRDKALEDVHEAFIKSGNIDRAKSFLK